MFAVCSPRIRSFARSFAFVSRFTTSLQPAPPLTHTTQPSATSSSIAPSEGQGATGVVAAGEAATGGAELELEAKEGAAEGMVV